MAHAWGSAQPARKTARVGWLGSINDGSALGSLPVEALRLGLADLGWKEGVNLVLERREGERNQVPALVAKLLRASVDVIVAQGPLALVARRYGIDAVDLHDQRRSGRGWTRGQPGACRRGIG